MTLTTTSAMMLVILTPLTRDSFNAFTVFIKWHLDDPQAAKSGGLLAAKPDILQSLEERIKNIFCV
jgi:hypothetical protein